MRKRNRRDQPAKRRARERVDWYFRYVVLDGYSRADARRTRRRSLDLHRAELAAIAYSFSESCTHAMVLDQQAGVIVFDVWRDGQTQRWARHHT